jgi:hypothetical protein
VASPRTVLTTRAVAWATSALSYDDTTVSALARHLGVDWHTAWDAIEVEAKARTSNPDRLSGVKTLGVDEHIWRPSRIGVDRAVTIIVDLSRDQAGCLHARLLDAVVGRSGSVYNFDTRGVSSGGTEAINLIIEKVRRLAHGFKNFDHYPLRILLAPQTGHAATAKARKHR